MTARSGLCACLCAALCAADLSALRQQPPDALARLEFTVSTGSQPVSNAQVLAVEERHQHVASGTTDAGGRVALLVPAGRYRVSALRNNDHGQTRTIDAAAGSAIDIRLQVTPADPFAAVPPGSGVVSGRVVDTNGDPVPFARVTVGQGWQSFGAGTTTADGVFRFAVQAHPSPAYFYNKVTVEEFVPPLTESPPTIVLPDRTELTQVVLVREKQETSGLELQVATAPHHRVTVTLRDHLDRVPLKANLTMFLPALLVGAVVRPDGIAIFPHVRVGRVTILASAEAPDGGRLAGVTELDVDRPIDDVMLTLVPAARLGGRVEFAGGSGVSPDSREPVRVVSTLPGRGFHQYRPSDPDGRVAADGSFALDGLIGARCFYVVNALPGWHLEAILLGGRDISDDPFMFDGGEQVENVIFRVARRSQALRRPICDPR